MSIGKRLKEAREKKKQTFEKVYKQTRIHPDVLNALEQDRYDDILNASYIKSFLKKYSDYLGLDSEQILEEYNKLRHKRKPVSEIPDEEERTQIMQDLKDKLVMALPVLKKLGILILALFVIRGAFIVGGKTKSKIVEIRKNIQVARKDREAKQEKKVLRQEPVKKPKREFTATPTKEFAAIPEGEKLILEIEATDDVWLQLKVDGSIIFENILNKGSIETWQADKDFSIWCGKANALKLTLNGQFIGNPGKGVVKDALVTRTGLKKK